MSQYHYTTIAEMQQNEILEHIKIKIIHYSMDHTLFLVLIYGNTHTICNIKMTNQLSQQIDMKIKSKISDLDTNIETDVQSLYDFEKTMDYYDVREEYQYVGIIDKEINRRKNIK